MIDIQIEEIRIIKITIIHQKMNIKINLIMKEKTKQKILNKKNNMIYNYNHPIKNKKNQFNLIIITIKGTFKEIR